MRCDTCSKKSFCDDEMEDKCRGGKYDLWESSVLWTLTSSDGRMFQADNPLKCAKLEIDSRKTEEEQINNTLKALRELGAIGTTFVKHDENGSQHVPAEEVYKDLSIRDANKRSLEIKIVGQMECDVEPVADALMLCEDEDVWKLIATLMKKNGIHKAELNEEGEAVISQRPVEDLAYVRQIGHNQGSYNMAEFDDNELKDKWIEFSNIQHANWMNPTPDAILRFVNWLKSGDNEDAWG